MLLLAVLLLVDSANAVVVVTPTYQHQDPITGQILTCNRCPPGHHMHEHCTATHQTKCSPCQPDHFTQYWNYLSKCLYCNNFCGENEFVKEECCPLHNRVCECKEGYYRHDESCTRHSECSLGYGVGQRGTAVRDTVCMRCSSGSYSSSSSAHETCTNHTDCSSLGLHTVIKGTSWHDNICASCEDLIIRGGLAYLRMILPNFFAKQKMKTHRKERFIKMLQHNGGAKERRDAEDPNLQNALKISVSEWVKDANDERLRALPEALRKLRLYNVADKLERKIKTIGSTYPCDNDI